MMNSGLKELLTEQQLKQQSEAEKAHELYAAEMRSLFANKAFVKHYAHTLLIAGYEASSYTVGDSGHTIFLEGRRSVAIDLIDFCDSIDPKFITKVMEEMRNASTRDNTSSNT